MKDAEPQDTNEVPEYQTDSTEDVEGQAAKLRVRAEQPTPPKGTGAAEDVEGQGFRPRGIDDDSAPSKEIHAEATESDADDVEGQAKRFFR